MRISPIHELAATTSVLQCWVAATAELCQDCREVVEDKELVVELDTDINEKEGGQVYREKEESDDS